MCAVNDAKRNEYNERIANLNKELENESKILNDLNQAKEEIQQLIDKAQYAIGNLDNCDFGGDRIIVSVITSRDGYQARSNYYDEYIIKCKNAIIEINDELEEVSRMKNSLPINCGFCSTCLKMQNTTTISTIK